jgi:CRISPR-associated DxTHG motif protein
MAMRTIITFLNDKGLKPGTVYQWHGRHYEGGVFSMALRQFVEHDRMLVCNTPEAELNTWPALLGLDDPRIVPVQIPKGESTPEMWKMFEVVTGQVGEGETVIFDITHGLRSLPFLVFLFAAYLKSAKHVQIEAIYYGALELGKPAPVIDLSEFVSILDWLTATDQFAQTGDARRLARLLNPDNRTSGVTFSASRALSDVSLAAFLCQPFQLIPQIGILEKCLQDAKTELAERARPFGLLHENIQHTFDAFKADFFTDVPAGLCAQFRLIEWYYGNNQMIQAVTLAREWLVSAVTLRLGQPIDLTPAARRKMERAISGLDRIGRRTTDELTGEKYTFTVDDLNEHGRQIHDNWSERDDLIKLWNELASVRNALDHAGHQAGAMTLGKIVSKAETEVMPRLRQLARRWDL